MIRFLGDKKEDFPGLDFLGLENHPGKSMMFHSSLTVL